MISQKAKNLKPSPTIALASKAKQLKAGGHDVISLTVGEPDWQPYSKIEEAGIKAIKKGQGRYTPASGLSELRESIARVTKSDLDISYELNEVTVSAGGKFIIYSALQAVIDPEDEVIVPAPFWVSYPTIAELAGGIPVVAVCGKEDGFKLTAEKLDHVLTEKSKLLILNSPSNPTGCVYTLEELKSLAEVIRKHPRLLVLSDDIYNRLVFEGEVAPHILQAAPDLKDRVLVMNGVAKSFAMTGWRVGWALGPSEWIGAMNRLQSQSVTCAPEMAQRATIVALDECLEEIPKTVEVLKSRRDLFVSALREVNGIEVDVPEGAFYVWPKISSFFGMKFNNEKISSSRDFARLFLEDQMVASVPGIEFGLEGYMRFSYAISPERLKEAVSRLEAFVSKLT